MMEADDQAHWAEANFVLRVHGTGALQHASDQVAERMHEADDAGMLRWFEIYERIEQVLAQSPACPTD
jgi:hypothetical protein